MKILVCLKQILDPDVPARDFRIDHEAKEAERGSAKLVPNIFCENAIETALQLRERSGGEITVLCYGAEEEAEDALRKALAMTVDHAVLVVREGSTNPDAWTVAKVLATAAGKLGGFDLVMVGRESGDWGVGQTGGLLAEELGVPAISLVDHLEAVDGGFEVKRQTEVGFEIARTSAPLLVTITNDENNVPRIPKTRDVMKSYRKPLTKWSLADLSLDTDEIRSGSSFYEVVDLGIPEKGVACEFIEGDDLEERVEKMAKRIAAVMDNVS